VETAFVRFTGLGLRGGDGVAPSLCRLTLLELVPLLLRQAEYWRSLWQQ
jgi:hypothetical protein